MPDSTQTRDLLAEVQRLVGVGIWEYDIPNDAVTWSDELHRMYGTDPATFEATYQGFLDRVHPDDRAMVDGTVGQAFQTHEAWSFDHRVIRTDGAVRWLHGRGHVDVVDGAPVRLFGTSLDITDRKRTEQRLRAFVADASHEMRTPTTSIAQATEFLLGMDLDLPEHAATMLGILERQSQRLVELTRGLLDLATVDNGRSLMLAPVPIDEVVDAVVHAFATDVETQIAIPQGLFAHAERAALEQVVTNLVANARVHGEPPIAIGAEVEDDEVVLSVCDHGPGVADDEVDDLFTPFVRSERGGGTGLGLPIVQSLVRAMGGSIRQATHEGHGACFAVRLAMATAPS